MSFLLIVSESLFYGSLLKKESLKGTILLTLSLTTMLICMNRKEKH